MKHVRSLKIVICGLILSVVLIGQPGGGRCPGEGIEIPNLTTVKGHVKFRNRPDLDDNSGAGIPIIFKKTGCDDCYFAVASDNKGMYEVQLAPGSYELIVRNPSDNYDLLPPDQKSKFSIVESVNNGMIVLDIDLTEGKCNINAPIIETN